MTLNATLKTYVTRHKSICSTKDVFNLLFFFYRVPSQRMNFVLKFIYLLQGEQKIAKFQMTNTAHPLYLLLLLYQHSDYKVVSRVIHCQDIILYFLFTLHHAGLRGDAVSIKQYTVQGGSLLYFLDCRLLRFYKKTQK